MKICLNHVVRRRSRHNAFTLVEVLISASIFLIVIMGIVYAHIAGLRLYTLSMAKMGASAQARQALTDMIWEVRAAQRVAIGTGSLTNFAELGDGTNQTGNSIQVYRADYDATNNNKSYIRWYRDTSGNVYRLQGTNSSADKIASSITNTLPFSAVDRSGNVFTNNDNNQVISVVFQFYQIQYPIVKIGTNLLYDFFQLSTKIAPRSI